MITKKAIPRRAFLRGIGATRGAAALRWHGPGVRVATRTSIARLSIVFAPNGMNMDTWTPAADGAALQLSPTLEPLAPFRDRLLVLSGLDNSIGDADPGKASRRRTNAPAASSSQAFTRSGKAAWASRSIRSPPRNSVGTRSWHRSSSGWTATTSSDSAKTAGAAPTRTRCRGGRPRRRCPLNTSRERYSSGCSATATARIPASAAPECDGTAASSTRSPKRPLVS